MKLAFRKDVFLKKIETASRFTSSKLSSSSSLQGVYLLGSGEKIDFYSTNLNFYYHSFLRISGAEKIKAVIEPKKIIEFLNLIDDSSIDIVFEEKRIRIESTKTKAEFPLFDSRDFPLPPAIQGKGRPLKMEFLKKNISSLLFSASGDDTRPILTGIDFVSDEEGMKLVSTDGFRLSLLSLKKEESFPPLIIPSLFFSEVMKIFDEDEILFGYSPEEKTIVFKGKDQEVYSRLIEGDYPPFEKVIPAEKKTTIILDREAFLRNVKLVSIFAREFSNIIILETEKDRIVLSPKTGEGEGNLAYQEAKIEGEKQRIAFNYKFVLDFLSNVSSGNIVIELLRNDAPAVFKGESKNNFIHIIMPVRVQE